MQAQERALATPLRRFYFKSLNNLINKRQDGLMVGILDPKQGMNGLGMGFPPKGDFRSSTYWVSVFKSVKWETKPSCYEESIGIQHGKCLGKPLARSWGTILAPLQEFSNFGKTQLPHPFRECNAEGLGGA